MRKPWKNRHQKSTIFSPLAFHRLRPHDLSKKWARGGGGRRDRVGREVLWLQGNFLQLQQGEPIRTWNPPVQVWMRSISGQHRVKIRSGDRCSEGGRGLEGRSGWNGSVAPRNVSNLGNFRLLLWFDFVWYFLAVDFLRLLSVLIWISGFEGQKILDVSFFSSVFRKEGKEGQCSSNFPITSEENYDLRDQGESLSELQTCLNSLLCE